MENDAEQLQVVNNEKESQFECDIDGAKAIAAYSRQPGKIIFTHTEVPRAMSGKGIGAKLVREGLDFARQNNLRVRADCGFVASYIERHKEYQDLVER